MKLGIIVNERSGSVPDGGLTDLEALIREAGHEPLPAPAADIDLKDQVATILRQAPDAIAVWGGDGTIACVLQEAGSDMPVLILPGGTMNLLPKRLHDGETDWRKVALSVLQRPVSQWISAGQVGERRFYVAALFGQLTQLGVSREAAREGEFLEAVGMLTSGESLDIESQLQIEVDLPDGMRNFPATAAAILPGETGGLEIAVIAPDSHLDLAAAALDSLVRGWRNGAHFHAEGARAIRISHAAGTDISATIDGEPCEPGAALDVTFIPRAANVLVTGDEA